ncbi:hypothetical protein WDW89_16280 [Deltaproteobacteria bacterium TL4]
MIQTEELKLDKTLFSVSSEFEDSEEKIYWSKKPPKERLMHMERLRRMNYGFRTTQRLQRVFEIA